jgi:long-subunit acyl-CoA synthetase (AMP-forming)
VSREIITTAEVLERTVDTHGEGIAQRTPAGEERTWAQTRELVHRLAGGLRSLGVARGQTVATMLVNRPEFLLVDMAAVFAGGTPMSIYVTSPVAEIAYLLDDAAVRVVVTEARFEPVLREAVARATVDPHVIVLADAGAEGLSPLLDACPAGWNGQVAARAVSLDDVAVMVYTSGTTGAPKGVQLTHRNLQATWRAADSVDPRVAQARRIISYLPPAHIADRLWGYLVPLRTGATITYLADPRQIVATMAEVRPSVFLGVPRIWEKLRAMLMGLDIDDPAELRARLGLDADTVSMTGAAPLDVEVLDFFERIGAPILEVYGMTETSGVISGNRVGRSKPGTVGFPFAGVEVKVAPDGEILVRGEDVLMLGYRGQPSKTAETIGADGWLRTGDIGDIDEDGMITIVDRKKEVIITSGGKNISPANIENLIRSATHLAGPVMALGDRRAYVTAIVSLDPDESRAWAAAHGRDGADPAELAGDPQLRAVIADAVEQANRQLARPAQVKRFAIVGEPWDAASGVVTPTLKLKRRVAADRYAAEIERLYAEERR